jgi:hypothetical protein
MKKRTLFLTTLLISFSMSLLAQQAASSSQSTSTTGSGALRPQTFGITASFSSGEQSTQTAQALYTLNEKTQLDFGFLFQNRGSGGGGTSESQFGILFGIKYFFSDITPTAGAVCPFIAGQLQFVSNDPRSSFTLGGGLGAQVFMTKGLAFFGVIGLGFTNDSPGGRGNSTTTFGTIAPAVGASFYF